MNLFFWGFFFFRLLAFSQAMSVSLIHIIGFLKCSAGSSSEMCRMKLNSPSWPIYCVKLGAAQGFLEKCHELMSCDKLTSTTNSPSHCWGWSQRVWSASKSPAEQDKHCDHYTCLLIKCLLKLDCINAKLRGRTTNAASIWASLLFFIPYSQSDLLFICLHYV